MLYKMMTVENLLRSIRNSYLHFNRVDSYSDFPGADANDGRQLPKDLPGNATAKFDSNPSFSAADYFNTSRARTYTCCFSLENSDFIWKNYASGSAKGKVCLVFDFAKLRSVINASMRPGNSALEHCGIKCHRIFSVNYGIVEYVAWDDHQANSDYIANPIKYTYLKSAEYCDEKELRISLSAFGLGKFVLQDGSEMAFPSGLQMGFDFSAAFSDGTIPEILYAADCDSDFLRSEMEKIRTSPRVDSPQ